MTPKKSQEKMIAEINERSIRMDMALFGMPETEDMGLYGIVKDAVKEIKEIDRRSRRNSVWINVGKGAFGFLVTGIIAGLTKLWNWW